VDDLRSRFGEVLAESIERVADLRTKVPGTARPRLRPVPVRLGLGDRLECLTRPEFRREHGITTPWADLLGWICDEADLASFDGTMDLSGRGRGLFALILGPHSEGDVEVGLDAAEAWLIASMPVATTA